MKLLLDMDGVITDFIGSWLKLVGLKFPMHWPLGEYSLTKVFNITDEEAWDRITEEFWINLEPYYWMPELLSELEKRFDEICLVTQGPVHVDYKHIGASGKIEWMKRHLPNYPFLIGTGRQFCANHDTILIDDYDGNVNQFRASGGNAVLFPQHWNTSARDIETRVPTTLTQVDKLLEKSFLIWDF